MKKIIITIIIVLFFFFALILLMDINDTKNKNELKKIINNTHIDNINYYNHYDKYYIIKDNENLYSYEEDFNLLDKISLQEICPLNYQIIYEDNQFMYLKDNYKKKKLTYEYYNIYNCKLINTISLGG